jgi:hypothetical protein
MSEAYEFYIVEFNSLESISFFYFFQFYNISINNILPRNELFIFFLKGVKV